MNRSDMEVIGVKGAPENKALGHLEHVAGRAGGARRNGLVRSLKLKLEKDNATRTTCRAEPSRSPGKSIRCVGVM